MTLKEKISHEELAKYLNPPNPSSYQDLGNKYNVSRQRIHQLYQEYSQEKPSLFQQNSMPTKEELQPKLDQGNTLQEVADNFHISLSTLIRLMKKYGLKKKFLKEKMHRRVLHRLYVEKEWSDDAIADYFGCSVNTVMKARYENKVYASMRKPISEKLTKRIFYDLYVKQDLSLQQLAELFSISRQQVVKLKKAYEIPKKRSKGVSDQKFKKIQNRYRRKGD